MRSDVLDIEQGPFRHLARTMSNHTAHGGWSGTGAVRIASALVGDGPFRGGGQIGSQTRLFKRQSPERALTGSEDLLVGKAEFAGGINSPEINHLWFGRAMKHDAGGAIGGEIDRRSVRCDAAQPGESLVAATVAGEVGL